MEIIFKPRAGFDRPKMHKLAISVCAFKSEKFSIDKHFKPFEALLAKTNLDYDILVFAEPGLEVPTNEHTRVYDVTSPADGYSKHLWRYAGALLNYPWVWCRGMDNPEPPAREERLRVAANILDLDVVIWQRLNCYCMGKLALSSRGAKEFFTYIKECEVDGQVWNCDEFLLSHWILRGDVRIMLALDETLELHPMTEDWIIRRLRRGQHITVVKDRDDRQLTSPPTPTRNHNVCPVSMILPEPHSQTSEIVSVSLTSAASNPQSPT